VGEQDAKVKGDGGAVTDDGDLGDSLRVGGITAQTRDPVRVRDLGRNLAPTQVSLAAAAVGVTRD
jgi:hypothetical protein